MTAPPFHEVWGRAVEETLTYGDDVSPRGKRCRERWDVSLTFDGNRPLLVNDRRNFNYRFAVAEFLWIARGDNRLVPLTRYNSKMAAYSDDGETLAGAYGPRLLHQWPYVLEILRKDPASRQAVMTIWYPDPAPSKDIPCTLGAQFAIRDDALRSIWTMRSSDLWLGLPYDAFTFARLAACVAGALDVPVGPVTIQAGSSHLYEEYWARAYDALNVPSWSVRVEPLPGFPPAWDASAWSGAWAPYAAVLSAQTSREALTILESAQDTIKRPEGVLTAHGFGKGAL